MTVTLNDRADFTLAAYRRVAVLGEKLEIGQAARARMNTARSAFLELLESDRGAFIYGTTTGGGALARVRIPAGEQREQALRRAANRSFGESFGIDALPERVVRGIVFARLVNFLEGHAKCRAEIAERIVALLDRPLPPVPLGGETSAGEIIALAHLMSALPDGDFQEGEHGTLLNGSPCSSALVADIALQAANRLALAEYVLGLSIEAINAPLEAYHGALADLWGDVFAANVLSNLGNLLEGADAQRRPYQAPVSYRVLPRVLGQVHRAVSQIESVAETSLKAITNNPVYLPPDLEHPRGVMLHTGGFHNAMAAPAIDALSAGWADLCTICDRHTTTLHSGAASMLPNMLVPEGADPGSGTSMLGFVQVGFGERARLAAARTHLPPSEGGGYGGQDDVALPTFLAFEKEQRVAQCLDACLAILAATASRALHVTNRRPAPKLMAFLELVRSYAPPAGARSVARQRGPELARLAGALGEAALTGHGLKEGPGPASGSADDAGETAS